VVDSEALRVDMDTTLDRWIEKESGKLSDSRPDLIRALCFRNNLYATVDRDEERILIGTVTDYLGYVRIDAEWEEIERQVVYLSMVETWR
jgi:hypothetical protein